MRALLALLPLLASPPTPAQEAPDPRLAQALTLDGHFPFEPPASIEEWRARSEHLRRRILLAAGLWPPIERGPLVATIHGSIDRGAYTVEKVILESWPGHFVTGSLYRPKERAPRATPAVLAPHGHWDGGRFCERGDAEVGAELAGGGERWPENARYHLQARCAQLARMGCTVLMYDMVGYADSRQLEHAAGFEDARALELGLSAFGLQTYHSLRALDFLAALPEVDPERIAVSGASGGGTQTFVLGAIDPRPRALFPAVMVSTGMQGGCVCENAPHLRVGTGNVELAALAAPRALGLTGADDWTRAILEDGFPELRALWHLFDAEERLAAWCHPGFGHNFNLVARGHLYAFLNTELALGLAEPIVEERLEPIPPAELSVWDAEHPPPPGGLEHLARLRAALEAAARAAWEGQPERGRALAEALEVLVEERAPEPGEIEAHVLSEGAQGSVRTRELLLVRRGTGERVRASVALPEPWNGVVVLATAREGRGSFETTAGRLGPTRAQVLARGAAFLGVDVLLAGPGEAAERALPVDAGRDGRYAGYTLGYNRALVAERARDLATAITFAQGIAGARALRLWAEGSASRWALLAAARAGEGLERLAISADVLAASAEPPSREDLLPGLARVGGLAGVLREGVLCPVLVCGEPPAELTVEVAAWASGSEDRARILDWLTDAAVDEPARR